MASKSKRGGAKNTNSTGRSPIQSTSKAKPKPKPKQNSSADDTRRKIQKIREVTNWTVEEDILRVLKVSNNDLNVAIEKITTGEMGHPGEDWTQVGKKKLKEKPKVEEKTLRPEVNPERGLGRGSGTRGKRGGPVNSNIGRGLNYNQSQNVRRIGGGSNTGSGGEGRNIHNASTDESTGITSDNKDAGSLGSFTGGVQSTASPHHSVPTTAPSSYQINEPSLRSKQHTTGQGVHLIGGPKKFSDVVKNTPGISSQNTSQQYSRSTGSGSDYNRNAGSTGASVHSNTYSREQQHPNYLQHDQIASTSLPTTEMAGLNLNEARSDSDTRSATISQYDNSEADQRVGNSSSLLGENNNSRGPYTHQKQGGGSSGSPNGKSQGGSGSNQRSSPSFKSSPTSGARSTTQRWKPKVQSKNENSSENSPNVNTISSTPSTSSSTDSQSHSNKITSSSSHGLPSHIDSRGIGGSYRLSELSSLTDETADDLEEGPVVLPTSSSLFKQKEKTGRFRFGSEASGGSAVGSTTIGRPSSSSEESNLVKNHPSSSERREQQHQQEEQDNKGVSNNVTGTGPNSAVANNAGAASDPNVHKQPQPQHHTQQQQQDEAAAQQRSHGSSSVHSSASSAVTAPTTVAIEDLESVPPDPMPPVYHYIQSPFVPHPSLYGQSGAFPEFMTDPGQQPIFYDHAMAQASSYGGGLNRPRTGTDPYGYPYAGFEEMQGQGADDKVQPQGGNAANSKQAGYNQAANAPYVGLQTGREQQPSPGAGTGSESEAAAAGGAQGAYAQNKHGQSAMLPNAYPMPFGSYPVNFYHPYLLQQYGYGPSAAAKSPQYFQRVPWTPYSGYPSAGALGSYPNAAGYGAPNAPGSGMMAAGAAGYPEEISSPDSFSSYAGVTAGGPRQNVPSYYGMPPEAGVSPPAVAQQPHPRNQQKKTGSNQNGGSGGGSAGGSKGQGHGYGNASELGGERYNKTRSEYDTYYDTNRQFSSGYIQQPKSQHQQGQMQ